MNKKISTILILIITGISAFSSEYQNVDAKTFQKLIQSGKGVIVDVRTSGEYSRGHIEGSTLISINDKAAVKKVNLLQKDKPVYLYCLSGSRSRSVAAYLSKNGFSHVYNLQRGIMEWQSYGLPLVINDAPKASSSRTFSQSEFNSILSSSPLVLVDFQAPWCAPCKKMNPIVDEIQENYKDKIHVQKMDVEANTSLQKTYEVVSIPGFILFKNGQKVWQHTGVMTYNELSKVIEAQLN